MSWVTTGAILGALGVALGAFGAHGLREAVTAERLEVFETAVRYHLIHAVALVLAGIAGAPRAGWAFLVGVLLFSGSLYLLVLTGTRWLGAVTPVGGLFFILGWVFLAVYGRA